MWFLLYLPIKVTRAVSQHGAAATWLNGNMRRRGCNSNMQFQAAAPLGQYVLCAVIRSDVDDSPAAQLPCCSYLSLSSDGPAF